jgi:release factor glutamine methyltransferase
VTVLEGIQRSTEFLARKGVESPRLQTELLLAEVLSLPRMRLYLSFERVLTEPEVERFRELIKRRGQREPLQYIVGSTSFCGFEIKVNPDVLIPRPETEMLAELGWKFLNERSEPVALDMGTGSGCLAITLAGNSAAARIYATDVSEKALDVARKNAADNGVADRLEFVHGDGLSAVRAGSQFDLIVSNPPYIAEAELATLAPEVREHEPREALNGGVDGLDFYRRLAAEGASHLKAGGKMMLEFGDGQSEPVSAEFKKQKWIVEAIVADYTRRPRILIARAEE